jgi:hypothetical protein
MKSKNQKRVEAMERTLACFVRYDNGKAPLNRVKHPKTFAEKQKLAKRVLQNTLDKLNEPEKGQWSVKLNNLFGVGWRE